ncbi:MAG: hypothetical protein ACQERS_11890 [Bacteroidota bacterium]
MADKTGTLWENISPTASCNHGFASHVVNVFYRDVLGIKTIDYKNKKIIFSIPDIEMDYCIGTMSLHDEMIKLEWKRDGRNIIRYSYSLPQGYEAKIVNESGCRLLIN